MVGKYGPKATVTLQIEIFRVVTTCSVVVGYRRFRVWSWREAA